MTIKENIYVSLRKRLLATFEKKIDNLEGYYKSYFNSSSYKTTFNPSKKTLSQEIKMIPSIIKEYNNFVNEFKFKFPFEDCNYNKKEEKYVIAVLKSKGIRLRNEYYLKTITQLLEEKHKKEVYSITIEITETYLLIINQTENGS